MSFSFVVFSWSTLGIPQSSAPGYVKVNIQLYDLDKYKAQNTVENTGRNSKTILQTIRMPVISLLRLP